jgi:hypothetical protein
MKRIPVVIAFTLMLIPAAVMAQTVIRVAPPPVVVERPGPVPGPRYVWIPGYQRWNGHGYVWVRGHYVVAPHPGAVWIPATYVARSGGYIFIAGHWR